MNKTLICLLSYWPEICIFNLSKIIQLCEDQQAKKIYKNNNKYLYRCGTPHKVI